MAFFFHFVKGPLSTLEFNYTLNMPHGLSKYHIDNEQSGLVLFKILSSNLKSI